MYDFFGCKSHLNLTYMIISAAFWDVVNLYDHVLIRPHGYDKYSVVFQKNYSRNLAVCSYFVEIRSG